MKKTRAAGARIVEKEHAAAIRVRVTKMNKSERQDFSDRASHQAVVCPFEKKYPSALIRDDLFFMTLAYNQAIEAWKLGEVPIGAVIVHEREVVACAHNQVIRSQDPTAHAEMLALTQASKALGQWRLSDSTLYVTKEPCPMCSGAAIMARLDSVVFGWGDPKMGCLGGASSLHSVPGLNHRLSVQSGVMLEECKELVQTFFQKKRALGKPLEDLTEA